MGHEAILYVGCAVGGGLITWLVLGFRTRVAIRNRRAADIERDALRESLTELEHESQRIIEGLEESLREIRDRAEHTIDMRLAADKGLFADFKRLGLSGDVAVASDEGERSEGQAVSAAQSAVQDVADRERELVGVLDDLERRAHMVYDTIRNASADDRRTGEQVDELVVAAGAAVGAASTMDNMMRKLHSNASGTFTLSTGVADEAERGYKAVHRMLDEIERIRELTGGVRHRIETLGDQVSGISHVVRVIQEITEKTNLLALNASIIAAQAGEHGRSFAVVATEIKALAHRTAKSTKEIIDQVRAVQFESERATAAIEDGVAAVGQGFDVAVSAGDALDTIRDKARDAQKQSQSMVRTLETQSRVNDQFADTAMAVSDKATAFASSMRGQSTLADRLRAAADEIQQATRQVRELVRSHGTSSSVCMEAIHRISEMLAEARRRERTVARGVSSLSTDADRGGDLSKDLTHHWSAVDEAANQLRSSFEALRERHLPLRAGRPEA